MSSKTFIQSVTMTVALTVLLGCSEQKFGLEGQNANFSSQVTYNSDVDVLFIMDSSGSMSSRLALMSSQIGPFVNALNATGLNYQIGVTTMDMGASGAKGRFLALPAGTPSVLNIGSANLVADLQARIGNGVVGSSLERGMQSMQAALTNPNITSTNLGFLRPSALLNVIFISDEDDASAPANYQAFLDQIKPPLASGARSWIAHFMGVTTANDPSCVTSSWGGYADPGLAYMALANTSGGAIVSICTGDLTSALTNVKARIVEIATEYHLASVPNVATIQVIVNGQAVPQSASNGWTYNAARQSVQFHGTAIPAPQASIQVNYTPSGIT
jgi:hypothetical protein